MKLGVNIDHIAVLREARRIYDPNPLNALEICERCGVDQITIHLREDRRHIQDDDLYLIMKYSKLPINLECAIEPSMIKIACEAKPNRVTLVPEKRAEVTTEGGLALTDDRLQNAINKLHNSGIEVSLFIDPNEEAIIKAKELGVEWIEFHTGHYANIFAALNTDIQKSHHRIADLDLPRDELEVKVKFELNNLEKLSKKANSIGLKVAAGHGLNYANVQAIVQIQNIEELNIGQSIIAKSIWIGFENAVIEMQKCISK